MDDVTRAQQDITLAGALAEQAITERQYINEAQLSKVGLGSVISILHKMDGIAPKLPTYLGYANTVMAALPDLLGITKPAHFLLFDVDSDELRSTGGFMGNYALITLENGRLVGGVKLHDTATFDCPKGAPFHCPYNLIPDQYAWMNADPTQFGMRDSNLSPDFPTSAKLIMSMYQQEMKVNNPTADASVDGVIMITPEIIKDILKATGSITVPNFKPVDANNLQDVIHYYHILNRNTVIGGNANQKAIDGLLGSALLHKVATLSAAQQSALVKLILEGVAAKDLQVYFNDTRLESLLTEFHIDSSIPMPPGMDGLMVTDVNVGATYYSRDMQENAVDTITFDAQGNAMHDLVLTYKLPKVNHLYTPIYVTSSGGILSPVSWYTGVARVIVPDGSKALSGYTTMPDGTLSAMTVNVCTITVYSPGCPVVYAPEAGHVVWAARINNMQVDLDTIVFEMKWMTPKVLKKVNGGMQYNLHLYKQAGSHINFDIKIIPPSKQQIVQPLAAPLKTPAHMAAGAAAEYIVNALDKDIMLTVTFTGS